MRSRKAQQPSNDERWVKVTAHVAELEDRIRLLEAKTRELQGQLRAVVPAPPPQKAPRRAARARPRPRCPGCTLELPKGQRSDYCVWCGFMLTAVRARTFR